jgi:hypothetical protein
MKNDVTLVDSRTAAALAQILPVLLLTLAVELRRTKLHRRLSRGRLMAFFVIFGLIETTLVLQVDGAIYPFQWFDICSALIIFGLLSIIFWVAFSDPGSDDGSPDN